MKNTIRPNLMNLKRVLNSGFYNKLLLADDFNTMIRLAPDVINNTFNDEYRLQSTIALQIQNSIK